MAVSQNLRYLFNRDYHLFKRLFKGHRGYRGFDPKPYLLRTSGDFFGQFYFSSLLSIGPLPQILGCVYSFWGLLSWFCERLVIFCVC